MQELDDIALLREYDERDSEEAFTTLAARHVNKVYSVALRHTGNPHQAEEITQAVFVILARKSRRLGKRVILSGWLYQTARLTAKTFLRSEIRRTRREREAHMQSVLNQSESETWLQIAPLLDDAMAGLNETDRHAVVLRFFDAKSMREVGAALGANEDAAKKRVNRALEKLQRFFLKRGITSTTAIIAGAISANSVQAAPVALAEYVAAVAMAKGAAVSGSTLTLIKGALKIMAWTKAKMAIVVGAGVLLAAGTTIVTVREIAAHKARLAQPAPTLGQEWLRSYAVNKNVADFSEAEDLSTPESAYAAFVRARARNDGSALERLSVATFRDLYRADPVARKSLTHFFNSPKGQAVIAQTRRAEIVEVWIYHDSAAEVIVRLPVPKPETDQFLAEAFQLEDGRWLFANDNVCNTLSQARDTATAKLAREGK